MNHLFALVSPVTTAIVKLNNIVSYFYHIKFLSTQLEQE